MKSFALVAATAACLAGVSPVSQAAVALPAVALPNTQTFTFVGQCAVNDCTGVGTGTLTLTGYTPGTQITRGEFIDFTYSSNIIRFDITPNQLGAFGGNLATLPGPNTVTIQGTTVITPQQALDVVTFQTDARGFWAIGLQQTFDFGSTHTWSGAAALPIPEPSTWLLTLTAAGLLAVGMRRRQA